MRVSRIAARRWRNLENLAIEMPAEARFVCLVGENGTGKTALLELLSVACSHLGLGGRHGYRRQVPSERGEPHDAEVALDLNDEPDLIAAGDDALRSLGLDPGGWDGILIAAMRGGDDPAHQPPLLPGFGGSSTTEAWWQSGVTASTPEFAGVASAVVTALAARPGVHSLYLDADRTFPDVDISDADVLAAAREDPTLPEWARQQAVQATSNLYAQWLRAMLGAKQRMATAFLASAQTDHAAGRQVVPPPDPLDSYRDALASVLPHLRFAGLDAKTRRLYYDSAGTRLEYGQLSSGERELAFLVGQVERFGVRDGLFLLDEPELHLNAELLRRWAEYLRGTIRSGQAWVATHALEVAEIAGPRATIVLERDADRRVRSAVPIGDRPVLGVLSRALGTPAFSLTRRRFVLIEGRRELGEGERMRRILGVDATVHMLEAASCGEVLRRLREARELASAAEQLRVGAIIDRDHRSDADAAKLAGDGCFVLPVHEIENAYIDPALLAVLIAQEGRQATEVPGLLQTAADPLLGRWALQRAAAHWCWQDLPDGLRGIAIGWSRDRISADRNGYIAALLSAMDVDEQTSRRRTRNLIAAVSAYEGIRTDLNDLAASCEGKEVSGAIAKALGLSGRDALERRAEAAWETGAVARPGFVAETRTYIEQLALLGA